MAKVERIIPGGKVEEVFVPDRSPAPLGMVNPSGILPTGFRVLVRPIEVEAKVGSIIIPDDSRDKEKFAQQEGILIAVSPAAFNYDDAIRDKAPQPGARVLYAKYVGFIRKGNDGLDYRIIEDKDVAAVLT